MRKNRVSWMAAVLCGAVLSGAGLAAAQAPSGIPDALRDWQDWVLKGEEYRRCPFIATQSPEDANAYRCAWPERLVLSVTGTSGSFSQGWQVYADGWVRLPGNAEYFPRDVLVNGIAGAVVLRDGVPALWLTAGRHTIAGDFLWTTRPESLPLPPQTALVQLTVDGQRIAQPERPNDSVWFGKRRSAEQPAALEVQVYRLVRDEIPVELETRIRLQVAGDPREELLARVLPDGFTPLSMSSTLAARLEPDGRLRVQVRPGSFELAIRARGTTVAAEIARPAQPGTWAREEVWSFQGNDRLRVAGPEGAEGIDPAQANVPGEWQSLSAFRMAADSVLRVVERSRGLANADENRLSLRRQLWLDFDHGGFTAVDSISGSMRKDWRLDMQAPYQLASASVNGEPVLVTLASQPDRIGVELRMPQLSLETVARTVQTRAALPATGWSTRFDTVSGVLHLPPGHRLLAAPGSDDAPGSWLDNWGLWNLFGVLVVVVFTGWVAGWGVASIGLVAFLLTYQEQPLFIWLWGNLLAAVAIARAAPEGRFRRFAGVYRSASFGVLAIALLPFLWMQVRVALYPQLESGMHFAPVSRPTAAAVAMTPASDVPMDAAAGAAAVAEAQQGLAVAEMPAEPPPEAKTRSRSEALEERLYTSGLNVQQKMQRYAPGTLLQAGPGIPGWHFNSYNYSWSGPVEAEQTVRFVFVGPALLLVWRLLGVLALVALFLALARVSYGFATRWPRAGRAGAGGAAAVLFLAVSLTTGSPANASSTPDPALLEQLKNRLVAPPKCVPNCAEIMDASVRAEGERLEVTLRASALAQVAVALPHANDRWQLDEVSVDGRAALAVGREGDASLWVPLAPGARTVRLSGRLAAAESIQLVFPQTPRVVTVTARGWSVAGVSDGRLTAGSIELTRDRSGTTDSEGEALESSAEFPAYVRVERDFNLDLDWTLSTAVMRIAPERAAINVSVPLVSGESVLTEGVEVRDSREAVVGLERDQGVFQWQSGLARSESLTVSLPENAGRAEVWRFLVNPQWQVTFDGFPAVLPENLDTGAWSFVFYPRPGETLRLAVSRPKPAEGVTFAIDSVTHAVTVGKRSSDAALTFSYRSTQGGRHAIAIPAAARVTQVTLDGIPVQLRPENGELSIALLPGQHQVSVQWQDSDGAGFRVQPAGIELRTPASNVTTTVQIPVDRWPLMAFGPGVGPAVLYWSELVVFILTTWLLGRWSFSPLRFHEWLLLGLGLSTLSWWVFALLAFWFFTMRWRERWDGSFGERSGARPASAAFGFNTVQVLLAGFSIVAIAALVFSGIRYGLLAAPDMGVAGPGSGGNAFSWFNDRTQSALARPTILTVPMWVYRGLMFAWALWIAIALVRWLRWAFKAWTARGFWRGIVATTAQPSG